MDNRETVIKEDVPCPIGTSSSVLNVEVSGVMSYSDTDEVCLVNLLEWLTTDLFKDKILYLRSLKTKEERDKCKSKLPVITPSGLFKNRIAEIELVKHSGLLAFDVDWKENLHITNYSDLKKQLSNIPNIAYCGLSASATGYWGLVKIAQIDKHKEHFEALYNAFKRLRIIIDKKPSNVASKRGCSYDPDAYFNHNPEVFLRFEEIRPSKKDVLVKPLTERKIAAPNHNNKMLKLKRYVDKIVEKEIDITGGYDIWFQIGCALANELQEEGREYFHAVSQFHPNYSEVATDRQFNRCLSTTYQYTMGTFYYICHDQDVYPKSQLND